MTAGPRIALVTSGDPRTRQTWSGIPFYMAKALGAHCGPVSCLGPFRPPLRLAGRGWSRLRRTLGGRPYDYERSMWMSRQYARQVRRRLEGERYDVIFAPGASPLIAHLETDIPIVYASDTTFGLNLDYYPEFSGYPPREARAGHAIERSAIAASAAVVMPSEWAAESARSTYGAPAERVHVVPFGANLDSPPSGEEATLPRSFGSCELLFLARDWARKGGDVAWQTVEALARMGVDARLTIVGCVPPDGRTSPYVRVIPYLDKDQPTHRTELRQLLLTSHFSLLPTRADCTPIAISEASAHGLPTIVTDTGGVRGALVDGQNGLLVPPGASGEDLAMLVAAFAQDPARHVSLSRSTRQTYEQRLTWDHWGAQMREILDAALARRGLAGLPS